jgi:hypothetical protein
MISLYVLDVEELQGVIEVASAAATSTRRVGDHVDIQSEAALAIDRRATGVRPAVWYSCVSALSGGVVVQFDKDALRIEPA